MNDASSTPPAGTEPSEPTTDTVDLDGASPTAPETEAAVADAEPAVAQAAPEPSALEAAPEPSALEAAPEPSALEAAPEPSAVEAAPESQPAGVDGAPEPAAVETVVADAEPAAVETAPEPAAADAAPEPAAVGTVVADAEPTVVETAPEPETAAGEPAAVETVVADAEPSTAAPSTAAPSTAAPSVVETAPEPEPAVGGAEPEPAAVETVVADAQPSGVESAPEPEPAAADAAPEPAVAEAVVAGAEPEPVEPAKPALRPSPAALAGLSRPAPPRPVGAAPGAAPAEAVVEAAEPPAAPPSDSHNFGRADEDGTVHVRLADGTEHVVGQYAAGTPDEGLAFYVRKYDDLSVEVDLAARRLAEGKASPEQAAAVVKRARESLESPSMVGDLASLTARVDALDALVGEKKGAAAELRAAAKAAALAAREAIVLEAEKLAESTQWKATGDRFKALLDDWKAAPRADRTSEQALWKRFSHARSLFDKHRRQYFARLDGERSEAKQVKEALVAEAESLQGSTDWGATAGAYRDLMARWKASGRAGKADEDALWVRFRAAQDAFFSARNAALGERDAGFAENLAAKEALLAEAEALDTSDLKAAKSSLRGIQERWEKIGHVPRGDKERIESRLRKVEDKVRHGEQEQWRRSNPEAKARADATVAQFSTSLQKLEKERDAFTAAGDTRKAEDVETRISTTKALLEAAERAAEEFSG